MHAIVHDALEIYMQDQADPLTPVVAPYDTVLIVDDCESERTLLAELLEAMDCRTQRACDGRSGVASLEADPPDLIVLDLMLPDVDGYDLIRHIKSNPKLVNIPVLVVSCLSQVQDRVKALELGAEDFIIKGFDRSEFEARVGRLLRLKHSLDRLSASCAAAMRQASTDDLTGLYNRAFFREMLDRELAYAQEHSQQLSLIFADVDHLKQFNDRYGHAYADQLLQAVAKGIRDSVSVSASAFRYGGDEFVVLLPHTDRQEACRLAERVRMGVESLTVALPKAEDFDRPHVTLSLGVANFPGDGCDADSLIRCSDKALYVAKRTGRNRLALATADLACQGTTCLSMDPV